MFLKNLKVALVLGIGLAISGCTAATTLPATNTALPTRSGALTPFQTATATVSPTPTNPSTPTPLPSPTPTPRTHTVKKGEDMFGIALRYHITLEELQAANPTVKPNFLSVGTPLVIPYSRTPVPETPAAGSLPSPTPMPLTVGKSNCLRARDGGAWCFLPVTNPSKKPVEGVSALIRLADQGAKTILPATAFLPLDVLKPGATMPLMAYYPADLVQTLEEPFQSSSEVLTALPSPQDGRYLPAQVVQPRIQIEENGLSADIQLQVRLNTNEGSAQRVWVLAWAYDAHDNIIGVRRWQNEATQTLAAGQSLPVKMSLYSIKAAIARVELAAEARP